MSMNVNIRLNMNIKMSINTNMNVKVDISVNVNVNKYINKAPRGSWISLAAASRPASRSWNSPKWTLRGYRFGVFRG